MLELPPDAFALCFPPDVAPAWGLVCVFVLEDAGTFLEDPTATVVPDLGAEPFPWPRGAAVLDWVCLGLGAER